MGFLNSLTDTNHAKSIFAERQREELMQFIFFLEMGEFYSRRLRELIPRLPLQEYVRVPDYRDIRQEAYSLIIELLRFQNWRLPKKDQT